MNKILDSIPLNLADYPKYVKLHLTTVPKTRELEIQARELIDNNFPKILLSDFITNVHIWGGHLDNISTVLANTTPDHFECALQALNSSPPDIENALISMTVIDGLGVSFGSKHLRFLCPKLCPILDSVLDNALYYPDDVVVLSTQPYKLFQRDIMQVSGQLEDSHIPNPMVRRSDRWYAADVDMALFAFLQRKAKKSAWVYKGQ